MQVCIIKLVLSDIFCKLRRSLPPHTLCFYIKTQQFRLYQLFTSRAFHQKQTHYFVSISLILPKNNDAVLSLYLYNGCFFRFFSIFLMPFWMLITKRAAKPVRKTWKNVSLNSFQTWKSEILFYSSNLHHLLVKLFLKIDFDVLF